MEKISNETRAVLFACYTAKSRSVENFVPAHTACYVQSGVLEFQLPDTRLCFKAGESFFVKGNSLARTTKYPGEDGEFRSISVYFNQDMLKDFAAENNLIKDTHCAVVPEVTALQDDKMLTNYFTSLSVYEAGQVPEALLHVKLSEGLILLLARYPELKNVLLDFSTPGKIDLEEFMVRNYKFNVEMKHFAHLTGRSLAAFKRDFEKIFHTSPSRWIQQKRLEEARYLIKDKGMKPSEVYLEVGFENLSHFSFAFKKSFGVAPSYIQHFDSLSSKPADVSM